MLDFLMNVVGWIIGNALWLIIILILVGILNIGAWVLNRITKGPERVEALMVVTTRDAVTRYVPEAITPSSWGGESIDPKPVISKLFGYAVSDRRFVTGVRHFFAKSLGRQTGPFFQG